MHHQQFTSAPVVFDDNDLDDVCEYEPVMNPDPFRVMPTGVVKDCRWRVPSRLRLGYTCSPCFIMNGVFCRAVIDKVKPTGHCGLFIQLAQDVPHFRTAVSLRGRLDVYEDKGDFVKGTMVASQEFNVKLTRIGDAWGSSYMFCLSHIEKFQTLLIDFSSVINGGMHRRPEITHFNDPRHSNLAIIDGSSREIIFYADKKTLETLVPTIHRIAYPARDAPGHGHTADSGNPLLLSSSNPWDSNEEGYHSGSSSKTNRRGIIQVSSNLSEMTYDSETNPQDQQQQQQQPPPPQQELPRRRRYNRTPPPIPTAAVQEAMERRRLRLRLPVASSPCSSSPSSSSSSPTSAASATASHAQLSGTGMEHWVLKPNVSRKAFRELLDCVYNNRLPEVIHIVRSEEFLTLCRDNHLVQPYQHYIMNLRGLMMRGIAPELLIKMLPIRAPETFVHVGNIIVSTIAAQWSVIPTRTKERLASFVKDPSGLLLPILLLLNGSAVGAASATSFSVNAAATTTTTSPTAAEEEALPAPQPPLERVLTKKPSRRAL
ncbi:hypothetical protein DFQ27_000523 [Actinomortierella ambigua]|uniref:Uncharacterized protein n=1 Tax=Actinomortierella ambigua TaxID=1343610 RepID=A0A9P6U9L3_9FUNG|nr:hypothetical protein DFQ27_000523 [Actinomortierella ambigua]